MRGKRGKREEGRGEGEGEKKIIIPLPPPRRLFLSSPSACAILEGYTQTQAPLFIFRSISLSIQPFLFLCKLSLSLPSYSTLPSFLSWNCRRSRQGRLSPPKDLCRRERNPESPTLGGGIVTLVPKTPNGLPTISRRWTRA